MRGNSVLLSFPRQPEFYLLQKHSHSLVEIVWLENHIVGAEAFEVMARDFCTWSTCLVRALGTFRRFPDTSRHSRKWWHGLPPTFSWCVYVCVRVHICVLENGKKWRRRIPPKKFKSEHAVVVAMLIIYFFKLFYLFTIVLPLSLISVVRFICICLLFYGSFCSIPLLLLLRRGLFTINLLVFLFTE